MNSLMKSCGKGCWITSVGVGVSVGATVAVSGGVAVGRSVGSPVGVRVGVAGWGTVPGPVGVSMGKGGVFSPWGASVANGVEARPYTLCWGRARPAMDVIRMAIRAKQAPRVAAIAKYERPLGRRRTYKTDRRGTIGAPPGGLEVQHDCVDEIPT